MKNKISKINSHPATLTITFIASLILCLLNVEKPSQWMLVVAGFNLHHVIKTTVEKSNKRHL